MLQLSLRQALLSNKNYNVGDVIFVESPLHIVCEESADPDFSRIKNLCDEEGDMVVCDETLRIYVCGCLGLRPVVVLVCCALAD